MTQVRITKNVRINIYCPIVQTSLNFHARNQVFRVAVRNEILARGDEKNVAFFHSPSADIAAAGSANHGNKAVGRNKVTAAAAFIDGKIFTFGNFYGRAFCAVAL